jgi:hypothetical protein
VKLQIKFETIMTKENTPPVNIQVIAGCEGEPIPGVGVRGTRG